MPIASFSGTPAIICPDATIGPYPPPLTPLLNQATRLSQTSFGREKANFFLRRIMIDAPIAVTRIAM